jgi:DNA-binding MarR family transcriptional regulator
MEKEEMRIALNKFLKLYFNACNEVYDEINFNQIKGIRFKYLKEIHKRKETTITELADHFNISKPTVTEVINHFIDNGIVKKRKCKTDKRISYIYLTDIGRQLATTNELESKRAVEKLFDILSKKEMKQLAKLFEKIGGTTL